MKRKECYTLYATHYILYSDIWRNKRVNEWTYEQWAVDGAIWQCMYVCECSVCTVYSVYYTWIGTSTRMNLLFASSIHNQVNSTRTSSTVEAAAAASTRTSTLLIPFHIQTHGTWNMDRIWLLDMQYRVKCSTLVVSSVRPLCYTFCYGSARFLSSYQTTSLFPSLR